MATPKEQDTLQALRQLDDALGKSPPPVLLVCGTERFLVNRALDAVKAAVLDPSTRDFNFDLIDGKDATPARILGAARTLPMMARRRLVLVRDLDELPAAELAGLLDYVASPVPETCLCLVAEKPDQRTRFFLALKKHGLVVKLDPLSDRQIPAFLKAEATRQKVRLQPGAVERIAEEVGADLGQLCDALDRLANYVPAGAAIGVEDVEAVVATTRQHSVYELVDAVGAGNRAQALALLAGILAAREPALKLVALLLRQVRQLWVTCAMGRCGAQELAAALGVSPYVAGRLQERARPLTPARLREMHEQIFLMDRALKSSKVEDARLMEALVLRLCRRDETVAA